MKTATAALALAAFSLPLAAHAEDRTWLGGTGSWNVPGNWSGSAVPTASDDAEIGSGEVTLGVGVTGAANELILGFGTSGDLRVSGGTLSVVESFVGFSPGRTAVAMISSGTWQNEHNLVIGVGGSGTLVMTQGSLSSTTSTIADHAGSSGVASFYGGIWENTGALYVGNAGSGAFNIFSGAVTASKTWIAKEASSIGVASLSGGILETSAVAKGLGAATVNFDGGTLRASANESDFLQGFTEGDVRLNGAGAIIDSNGYDIAINTVLSGNGGLAKIGANSLTLTGNHTYTGGTVVNSGKLVLGDATRDGRLVAGQDRVAVTLAGGDFDLVRGTVTGGVGAQGTTSGYDGYSGVQQNATGRISNSGTIRGGQGGAAELSGVGAVRGGDGGAGVTISSSSLTSNSGLILGGTGGNATTGLGASFGGGGGSGVSLSGSGTVVNSGTLMGGTGGSGAFQGIAGSGVRIWNGSTVVNEVGGVISGGSNATGPRSYGIQAGGGPARLVNKGTIAGGIFMGDFANEVTLHTGSAIVEGRLNMGGGNSSHLALDGDGSQNLSTAIGTGLIFTGSVTKQGAGTWTVDRSVSASGGVKIEEGTLVITDPGSGFSVLGSGGVTVGQNGKLAGVGPVLGNSRVAGMLAPGNSVDELQFGGDLFLEDTATVQIELAALNLFDSISVDGLLTYDGTLSIVLVDGYRPNADDSFEIFDPGSIVPDGAFDTIVFDVAGYEGVFNGSTGVLTIFAVPEPSSLGLCVLGGLTLLRRRRSQRCCVPARIPGQVRSLPVFK